MIMWRAITFLSIFGVFVWPGTIFNRVLASSDVLLPYAWSVLKPATCMPATCFCEPVGLGLIRQPVNTWSNLGFVIAGIMVFLFLVRDLTHPLPGDNLNLMRSRQIYPVVYGITAILIGLSSMLYHSSLTFFGQVLDILTMYLLASFMLFYNLSRRFRMKSSTFFGWYAGVNILIGYISVALPETRRYIFIAILVGILLTEGIAILRRTSNLKMTYLWSAFTCLALACTAWILDITATLCMPHSWFQAHSIWHLGMAGAIWFIYLYYRSEETFE
jgi:hypothetical protein